MGRKLLFNGKGLFYFGAYLFYADRLRLKLPLSINVPLNCSVILRAYVFMRMKDVTQKLATVSFRHFSRKPLNSILQNHD